MKRFLIIMGCLLGVAAAAYIGASVFFGSHFYPGSYVAGIDSSMKTAEEVKADLMQEAADYRLTLKEADRDDEYVAGSDVGLTLDLSGGEVETLLEGQKGYLFPTAFAESESTTFCVGCAG